MRGKLVAGKIAIGNCQAAYNPPAQIRAIMTSTARDWFETSRARFTVVPLTQASVAPGNKFQSSSQGFSICHFSFFIRRFYFVSVRVISWIACLADK
jgi:hypothetical protein